jgi:alpha-galactosidase
MTCAVLPGRPWFLVSALALAGVILSASQPLRLATPQAEFEVLPSGRILAFRLQGGTRLSLDEPRSNRDLEPRLLDLGRADVLNGGRRLEIPMVGRGPLTRILVLEVREETPTALFSSVRMTNSSARPVQTRALELLRTRFRKGPLWSFQGASVGWGLDDVMELHPGKRQNPMGSQLKGGYGGGIPVTAFWNATTGEALGCLASVPCALPVRMAQDGRVEASLEFPSRTLAAGETWSSPWGFLSVHSGDFYEPVRLWSHLMGQSGWKSSQPSPEAFEASWCSWGYGFDITPAQMLGALPKLKELGITWATLDDRWFDAYGDWNPRQDTFPGNSMKEMVEAYHKAGEKVQLWWLPIAAEIANGKGESHRYRQSQVVRDHPDWLVLDPKGRPATMVRDLVVLDPSLPEVQAYFRDMAVRFTRDYGFDGFKMDNVYTVPPCYNPRHHHQSPLESTQAVGEVYRIILEAVHTLKPGAVIQICPCGTTPAADWLPWMDQAVTADPVGAVQVRRRIKLYKALLGPAAAVYGDHVELSVMSPLGRDEWLETGEDFASTVGTGGVVGTKFVWPPLGLVPKSGPVDLTPTKDAAWRKWLGIYNQRRLASGTFLNLYTLGIDLPEGYAIAKDGRMHYAFFAQGDWKGDVELRGLEPGTYRVKDYGAGRDLGSVEVIPGKTPHLSVAFKDHLLLEVGTFNKGLP